MIARGGGLAFAGWCLIACAGHFSSGKTAYNAGDYPDAKRELVLAEADSGDWDEKRRCEYALYRGLTHEALGDRVAARSWLEQAKATDDAHPGTLGPDDRARLDLAWRSLTAPAAAAAP